jgi:hypothetical protein
VGSTRYGAQVRLTSGSPVGHTVGWRCMATDDANCYSTLSLSEYRDITAAAACNSKPAERVPSSRSKVSQTGCKRKGNL